MVTSRSDSEGKPCCHDAGLHTLLFYPVAIAVVAIVVVVIVVVIVIVIVILKPDENDGQW